MTERHAAASLPNPLELLWRQFRIEWRLYARDRGAMFWTFLFPLLMLFGFGVIFRSGGPPALTLVRVAPEQTSARDAAFVKALEDSHLKVLTLPTKEAEARWEKGETMAQIESAGFAVDYLDVRHAETLAPITSVADGPARLLVAAKLGRTRLIDNIGV